MAKSLTIKRKSMETPNSPHGNSANKVSRALSISSSNSAHSIQSDLDIADTITEQDHLTCQEDLNNYEINEAISDTYIVYMKGNSANLAQMAYNKPIDFKSTFESTFGAPTDLQIHHKTQCVKITCSSEEQLNQLMDAVTFMDERIHATLPKQPRPSVASATVPSTPNSALTHRVIIHGVAASLTNDEIQFETNACQVRKLANPNQVVDNQLTSVVLSFLDTPPNFVRIGYAQYRTKLYVQRPIRCNTCQALGHTTTKCRNQIVKCSYCTGAHAYNDCPKKQSNQPPLCANCKGTHSAAYRLCPNYVESQQALSLQATDRISYRDALTKIRSTTPATPPPIQPSTPATTAMPNHHSTSTLSATTTQIIPPNLTHPHPSALPPSTQRLMNLESQYEAIRGILDSHAQQIQSLADNIATNNHKTNEFILKLSSEFKSSMQANADILQKSYEDMEERIQRRTELIMHQLVERFTSTQLKQSAPAPTNQSNTPQSTHSHTQATPTQSLKQPAKLRNGRPA